MNFCTDKLEVWAETQHNDLLFISSLVVIVVIMPMFGVIIGADFYWVITRLKCRKIKVCQNRTCFIQCMCRKYTQADTKEELAEAKQLIDEAEEKGVSKEVVRYLKVLYKNAEALTESIQMIDKAEE